tara:strand:+ start:357 stop:926 length:570 start_codon:yes stop_codon:yes gene_type:complete
MAEPQLIVVSGIPVKSHEEIAQKWIFVLFWANLFYFVYLCNLYNEQNQLLAISFSFIICGVYLPFYGYKAVKNNKTRFFSIILSMISLFGIVSALASISFYYSLSEMCADCKDIFENGDIDCNVAVTKNEVVYITADECFAIPAETTFLTQHLLKFVVNSIGMFTACTVTDKRKPAPVIMTVADIPDFV